jgi:hypothetical protein
MSPAAVTLRCAPRLVLLFFVVIAAMAVCPAAARSFPCNCYHGSIVTLRPRCECACDPGYLLPDCTYTASDIVSIEVWYDFTSGQYVRERRLQRLTAGLAPVTANITFVYAQQGNYGKMSAVYKLAGRDAYNLKASVDAGAAWTVAENIFAAYDLFTRVEQAPDARAHPTVVYSRGELVITAEGIGYLAAVVATVFFILFVELCCCPGGNTAKDIGDDIMVGAWDVRLGYGREMTYKHEPPPGGGSDESPRKS